MSEAHTPGPWLMVSNTVYSLTHAGWRKGVEQFKNRFHAYVQADKECPDDEHTANVRLIAAAPDLLEAAKALVAADDARSNVQPLYESACALARAAIAKATGGQS